MASLQPANSLQIIHESLSLSAIILHFTYSKTGMHSPSLNAEQRMISAELQSASLLYNDGLLSW
jgi:hypothetical protein